MIFVPLRCLESGVRCLSPPCTAHGPESLLCVPIQPQPLASVSSVNPPCRLTKRSACPEPWPCLVRLRKDAAASSWPCRLPSCSECPLRCPGPGGSPWGSSGCWPLLPWEGFAPVTRFVYPVSPDTVPSDPKLASRTCCPSFNKIQDGLRLRTSALTVSSLRMKTQ